MFGRKSKPAKRGAHFNDAGDLVMPWSDSDYSECARCGTEFPAGITNCLGCGAHEGLARIS